MASRERVTPRVPHQYSAKDDALIQSCYAKMGAQAVAEMLGVTAKAVRQRVYRMRLQGLQVEGPQPIQTSTERPRNRTRPQLSDEAKAAKAAYNREWRKKNPEKVAAQQERYWSKKARQAKEGGAS